MRALARLIPILVVTLIATHAAGQTHQDVAIRETSLAGYGGEVYIGGNDGSASSSYPFALPANRGRYQPSLTLRYNSNAGSSAYGVGWSLPLTYIERGMRGSPDNVSSPNPRLRYWLSGSPLVRVGVDHYRSDVSNSFLDVVRTGPEQAPTLWSATDARGNQYQFNRSSLCNAVATCTRWYLGEVMDVDGNVTEFDYQPEGASASMLLTGIRYNPYDPNSPSNTGRVVNGAYATLIDLEYEADPHPLIEVVAGTLVEHTRRLADVQIRNRGKQSFVTLLKYGIKYIQSPETQRSLLSEIQLSGLNGATGPRPTRFLYQGRLDAGAASYAGLRDAVPVEIPDGLPEEKHPPIWKCRPWVETLPGTHIVDPSDCEIDALAAWIDIDGDKKPDLVWGGHSTGIRWARNVSPVGASVLSFAKIEVLPGSEDFGARVSFDHPTGEHIADHLSFGGTAVLSRIMDINNDGLPDLVTAQSGSLGSSCGLEIRFGRGSAGFGPPVCMHASAAAYNEVDTQLTHWGFPISVSMRNGDTIVDLVDLTGDGIPDYVIATKNDGWHVYPGLQLRDGTWMFAPAFRRFTPLNAPAGTWAPLRQIRNGTTLIDLLDVNGDGLADRVLASATSPGTWNVEYNTGSDFQSGMSSWQTSDPAVHGIAEATMEDPAGDEDALGYRGIVADLNGDGLPDYVYKPAPGELNCPAAGVPCPFVVSWNEGLGFGTHSKTSIVMPKRPVGPTTAIADLLPFLRRAPGVDAGFLIDANGDGILDYVETDSAQKKWYFYAGTAQRGANRPDILTSIVSPLLAQTDLTYVPSSTFESVSLAAIFPVVRESRVTGPQLKENRTLFAYASAAVSPSWDDPARQESFGFLESWSQDSTTGNVTHSHRNNTHALAGTPYLVEQGVPVGPPPPGGPATLLSVFTQVRYTWTARSLVSGACSSTLAPADYPAIPFASKVITTRTDNNMSLWSSVTANCADVDDAGNVGAVASDTETSAVGYTEQTTFDAHAVCRSCPVRKRITDSTGTLLSDEYLRYDSPTGTADHPLPRGQAGTGHLNYLERWAAGSNYEVAVRTSFSGNGNAAFTEQTDPYVRVDLLYDPFQLRVTRSTLSDHGTVSLVTETSYDDTGRPALGSGPYVAGSSAAKVQRGYAFDPFGRLVAIARQPINGNTVSQALQAIEYADSSSPAEIRSYTFASRADFTLGAVPQSSDVKVTIVYLDGLGRQIQVRERLGGSSAASSDSQIVQILSGYRVTNAALLDGAGRVTATLEPFYSQNGQFEDYASGAGLTAPGLHATVKSYDAQNRPSCSVYRPIFGSVPATACISDFPFPENPGYRLATLTSYGMEEIEHRNYSFIDTIPARENVQNGRRGHIRQYFDAMGRLVFARDASGNLTAIRRDALGRPVATALTASVAPSTITYDGIGRPILKKDPANVEKVFRYLASGQLAHMGYNPTAAVPDGIVGVDYVYGSLGRLTETRQVRWQNVGGHWQPTTITSGAFSYDQPYAQAGSGPYAFTAGRMSSAKSPATTLAFGYDEDGAVVRRDQWFSGIATPYRVVRQTRNDARILSTTVNVPGLANPLTYRTSYDSAGMPARIERAGQVFWQTVTSAGSPGPYDAVGRLLLTKLDDGLIANAQSFSPYSNLLSSQRVSLQTADLVAFSDMRYAGPDLAGYRDGVGATRYAMEYDCDGRLARAVATPQGTSPLTQRYDQSFSFFRTKAFTSPSVCLSDASLWNIEKVKDQSQTGTGAEQIYNYSASDEVASTTSGMVVTDTYGYDDRGNIVSRNQIQDMFAYDPEGRLIQIKRESAVAETLEYDAFGGLARRVLPTEHGVAQSTAILYLGPDATVSVTSGVEPRVQASAHVLLGGLRIASVRDDSVLYYHRDRLGSVVATSLRGGQRGASYRYGPYGVIAAKDGETTANASELGFTGARILTGGFVHLNARVYDPRLRRFLQPDSVDSMRYTYTGGDPVNRTDPTGLAWYTLKRGPRPFGENTQEELEGGGGGESYWDLKKEYYFQQGGWNRLLNSEPTWEEYWWNWFNTAPERDWAEMTGQAEAMVRAISMYRTEMEMQGIDVSYDQAEAKINSMMPSQQAPSNNDATLKMHCSSCNFKRAETSNECSTCSFEGEAEVIEGQVPSPEWNWEMFWQKITFGAAQGFTVGLVPLVLGPETAPAIPVFVAGGAIKGAGAYTWGYIEQYWNWAQNAPAPTAPSP